MYIYEHIYIYIEGVSWDCPASLVYCRDGNTMNACRGQSLHFAGKARCPQWHSRIVSPQWRLQECFSKDPGMWRVQSWFFFVMGRVRLKNKQTWISWGKIMILSVYHHEILNFLGTRWWPAGEATSSGNKLWKDVTHLPSFGVKRLSATHSLISKSHMCKIRQTSNLGPGAPDYPALCLSRNAIYHMGIDDRSTCDIPKSCMLSSKQHIYIYIFFVSCLTSVTVVKTISY